MKAKSFFSVLFVLFFFDCEIFSQGIPETINFQGVLKDASGNVVTNGNYNLTFKIYDAGVGGTMLWSETKTVQVEGGIFTTQLGSVNPINLPFDGAYWVAVSLGSDPEMTPRMQFTSVPYSRISLTVPDNSLTAAKIHSGQVVKSINGLKDNVNLVAGSNVTITASGNDLTISSAGGGGGTVTQVNTGAGLTGGPITTTGTISILNDGITTAMLQNNSVTSDKISDGTIGTNDLANNSVTSAKVADGTIVTADLGDNSVTSGKIVDGTITATDIGNTQVVKSINSLKDNVNLVAGSNITITPSGQNLTISSTSGGIGGSGTSNYLPLFSGSTTLGNSIVYQNAGNIGINATDPTERLDVLGDIEFGATTPIKLKNKVGVSGWWGLTLNIAGTDHFSFDRLGTATISNKLGIGVNEPQYPLHISTNKKYAGYFTSDSVSYITHVTHSEFTGTGYQDAVAVYGKSIPSDSWGIGGMFEAGYKGVNAKVTPTGNWYYLGLESNVIGGSGTNYALYGEASGTGINYGIYARGYGGTTNWAGYFSGNVNVTGTLSKGGGSFKIDHPLDPQNKYLYHSFVESPDMKNIYDGTVITDASGYATVTLPEWFEALNKDFRYQLTVIGDFAQAIISQKIQNNQFTIRTDKPNVEVSWQVTGIRKDAFAEKYRVPVEEYKKGDDIGKYLHPEAFGLPETMGIDYKHIKADKERGIK